MDFFSKFKMRELDAVMVRLKKMTCSKGYTVIRQGDTGDAFYMISKGRVAVWQTPKRGKARYLATLSENEFFGEMALLQDTSRTATVIAEEPCEFFVLYRVDFEETLMKNPAIVATMNKVIKKRQAVVLV